MSDDSFFLRLKRGRPIDQARERIKAYGVVEQEAILAIAAILENFPYLTTDIDLSQLDEGRIGNPPLDWHRAITKLWSVPPGLRDRVWKDNKVEWLNQDHFKIIDELRATFRVRDTRPGMVR